MTADFAIPPASSLPLFASPSSKNTLKTKELLEGGKMMSANTALKVKRMKANALPSQSAVFGVEPAEIERRVAAMLSAGKNPAIFIPHPDKNNIAAALESFGFVPDITVSGADELRHIHRICGKTHIYYFANIGPETISANLKLRDKSALKAYNPHTGLTDSVQRGVDGSLSLTLAPYESLFLVSE